MPGLLSQTSNVLASILGAVRDPQFRADVRQGLLDAGNRGAVAGLLGGPVDLATMALRPLGYAVDKPVMGSEWIGQKMQDAGMVSPNRNALAEGLASIALPAAAPMLGRGVYAAEQAAARNAMAPTPFNSGTRGQGGGVLVDAASQTADEAARMQRMKDMGLERGWYRGGQVPQTKRTGPWYTQNIDEAADYARNRGGDVREYAIPAGDYLNAGANYSNKLAHDVAQIISDPSFGKPGAQLAAELKTFGPQEPISGGALWQALEARFGNDGAAEVLSKLSFKGAKGITGGPEAYVFKTAPVRDAARAKFDLSKLNIDDILAGVSVPVGAGLLGMAVPRTQQPD